MDRPSAPNAGRRLGARGLWFAAREQFERWRADAVTAGSAIDQVPIEQALGMVALGQAEWEEALHHFDLANAAARPLASTVQLIKIALNRSRALTGQCQFKAAIAAVEEALMLCTPQTPKDLVAPAQLNLGAIRLYLGDAAGAVDPLTAAWALYEEQGNHRMMGRALCNLAIYHHEMGDLATAIAQLDNAILLAEKSDDAQGLAFACTERGRIALAQLDPTTAVTCGGRALDTIWNNFHSLNKEEVARVCALFGQVARVTGDHRLARRFLDRAAVYFGQLSLWREYDQVQAGLTAIAGSQNPGADLRLPALAAERLAYFTALLDLLDSIESIYPDLRREGEWLTHYSLMLGTAVGCERAEMAVLSHAGRLCDIGLTPLEEMAVAQGDAGERYRLHPTMSEQWLLPFPLPDGCLPAVRHHHESWDGLGYPDRLEGEAIPRTARILHVCHLYLTAAKQGGHGQAMARLREEAGTRLDSSLVAAFVAMHEE